MSLLGIMEVRQKSDIEDEGFEYMFQDYVIKGYTSQYVVQVSSIIQLTVRTIDERHDGVNNTILQSDNSTCCASTNYVPFIYKLNTELRENNKATITH